MAARDDKKSSASILESIDDAFYFIHVQKAKGEVEMKIENPMYVVSMDRTDGVRLGLKLDVQVATRCLFIKEVLGGLAMQHNESASELKVKPGDRIVRVNSVENDAHLMLEECKKRQTLELELHRGSAVPIMAGLSATVKTAFGHFAEGSEGSVTKVDDDGDALVKLQGAVHQWVCKQDYDKFTFEDADRYYLKRFQDFKEFYLALKPKVDAGSTPIKTLPEFPHDEHFGFRRHLSAFGMSSFMADRKVALQKCLNAILAQVQKLEDEPLLNEFFGGSPLPKVGEEKEDALKEKLEILVLKHQAQSAN